MRTTALRFLCCPECRHALRLEVCQENGEDVDSGWLVCPQCPGAYPIVRGIPRFVASDRYAARGDRSVLSTIQLDSANGTRDAEDTLRACTGWTDLDCRGRLVLDIGVGTGRFAEVVARFGGEVVGVDFNAAVDTAHHSLRALNNVHLIQADLSALPLRDNTFDLAYAMGVLHHTPDPESVVARMAGAVKPSGGLAVMLHNHEGLSRRALEIIRQVTTRLPLSATLALTAAAIVIYYPCRLPVLGALLRALCPISLHPQWRCRWLDTFESCTATYQWPLTSVEVGRWFGVNGFSDVAMLDRPICVKGRKELATANDEQPAPRRALAAGR